MIQTIWDRQGVRKDQSCVLLALCGRIDAMKNGFLMPE
ncbi:hypothetical protein P792_02695 [Asaia sp. SF2.1]|nr:hypothetical protein P792_02695 [Asaia sp. SF2.1]